MKKCMWIFILTNLLSIAINAQSTKFGALAVDRGNGFYYGWAAGFATLLEAEQAAVGECAKKGGTCTIVLTYSGNGCAAYRTIDGNVGTAYGWAVANTKEEADKIATQECLKRSNGINPSNFVWSCNGDTSPLKEIFNAMNTASEPFAVISGYAGIPDQIIELAPDNIKVISKQGTEIPVCVIEPFKIENIDVEYMNNNYSNVWVKSEEWKKIKNQFMQKVKNQYGGGLEAVRIYIDIYSTKMDAMKQLSQIKTANPKPVDMNK